MNIIIRNDLKKLLTIITLQFLLKYLFFQAKQQKWTYTNWIIQQVRNQSVFSEHSFDDQGYNNIRFWKLHLASPEQIRYWSSCFIPKRNRLVNITNFKYVSPIPFFYTNIFPDKPTIELSTEKEYQMKNDRTIVTCTVAAYPEPLIYWEFKPCLNNLCEYVRVSKKHS